MFQSADSAPSSTALGAPVIGAIVHQSSPLSPTNWHKISPFLSSPHKERTITKVSISFHPPFFWTTAEQSCSCSWGSVSWFHVQWVDIGWPHITLKGTVQHSEMQAYCQDLDEMICNALTSVYALIRLAVIYFGLKTFKACNVQTIPCKKTQLVIFTQMKC